MRIGDWSSDVCSSDLRGVQQARVGRVPGIPVAPLAVRQPRRNRQVARYILELMQPGFLEVAQQATRLHEPAWVALGQPLETGHRQPRLHPQHRLFIHARAVLNPIEGQPDAEFLAQRRSEEHTSELQSLMRISYAVFCLKKKKKQQNTNIHYKHNYPKHKYS